MDRATALEKYAHLDITLHIDAQGTAYTAEDLYQDSKEDVEASASSSHERPKSRRSGRPSDPHPTRDISHQAEHLHHETSPDQAHEARRSYTRPQTRRSRPPSDTEEPSSSCTSSASNTTRRSLSHSPPRPSPPKKPTKPTLQPPPTLPSHFTPSHTHTPRSQHVLGLKHTYNTHSLRPRGELQMHARDIDGVFCRMGGVKMGAPPGLGGRLGECEGGGGGGGEGSMMPTFVHFRAEMREGVDR